MMDDGKIRFIQLTDKEDQVQEGDKIVTSSVSNKFLKGILIGYISEVSTEDVYKRQQYSCFGCSEG